ncbi:MAG: hypothetical protein A2817_01670 [Candidatus Yanofskybacteria bacterium RIFCSPHIGHO2_01_FULL_39_8b]|uniref:Uncharacterized protein n=1 Tax=Candidatus Yanofskybacteria bacterium RIFCSPHIGHO2_01_FULL_39_8b TaxID=1802659 RepID=A0A1F8EES5_9BACT|nr:MAG: hypothetical protein A2817_01670 [Candidatus Yanofskybacteria bacterium RIFCSPHIGHO2_01_FULL_39_8b]
MAKRRSEPKISLAMTFLEIRSLSCAIFDRFSAFSIQFFMGSTQDVCLVVRLAIFSSRVLFSEISLVFSARYISRSISWSK